MKHLHRASSRLDFECSMNSRMWPISAEWMALWFLCCTRRPWNWSRCDREWRAVPHPDPCLLIVQDKAHMSLLQIVWLKWQKNMPKAPIVEWMLSVVCKIANLYIAIDTRASHLPNLYCLPFQLKQAAALPPAQSFVKLPHTLNSMVSWPVPAIFSPSSECNWFRSNSVPYTGSFSLQSLPITSACKC